MNPYFVGLMLVFIRLQQYLLERRISRSFDSQLSLDLDKCIAIKEILLGK